MATWFIGRGSDRTLEKIIFVKRPLAQYRWHQTNRTVFVAPNLKSLVVDVWSTMQMAEAPEK